jgi:uncharacterized protein (DUF1810 family)
MTDGFDLSRFVTAQDDHATYQQALDELRDGRKRSHWMWFVFPQTAGLGHSGTARHFAIAGRDEAAAYLGHPVLGPRLRECASVLTSLPGTDAVAVLGPVDAMKLRSSMTLFAAAAPDETVFREVLEKYFDGEPDQRTLDQLG